MRALGQHHGADLLDALVHVEEHDEEHQRDPSATLLQMPSPNHTAKIGARITRGMELAP
jgi:hypothetical protein